MREENEQVVPGDFVQVTVYAQIKEPFSDGSGYWVTVNGVDLAVQQQQIQHAVQLNQLSERAQRILEILYDLKGRYIAGRTLGEQLGGTASSIQGASVLHGSEWTQNDYEKALRELVDLGVVEEVPHLSERWHLVVKNGSGLDGVV